MRRQASFPIFGGQRVEGARMGGTRERLVAIDETEERQRFLFERMNDAPVADDMTTQIAVGAAAPQGQERHKTLAAEHDMNVLSARKGESEMIETMRQRRAVDDDFEFVHVGEIG